MPPLRLSYCLLLLCSFWAAIYLPALATRELQGEEARRVLPGRTMMQNGDWMLPRSGGAIYNRKPPLVNWMSAAAIKLTGRMDEWTVRVPATLMMLALGIGVFAFLRGWLGNEQALLAALITLTNIGFIEKGRIIEIEALYMSLFGIALAAWLGLRWQGKDLAAWAVSGLVLGLGFLAKGPVHMLYFYGLVIGVLVTEKKMSELKHWKHLTGLACFFAVWVPWAIINSQRNVQRDSGKVWMDQITHRLGFEEFDFVNYLLQAPQSLVNFLPWVLLLPLCWRVSYGDNRHGQWLRGLRKGLVISFFIVALLPSSRPRFMLPLNVAAAILVADTLMRLSVERLSVINKRWRLVFQALAMLGALAIIIAPVWQWQSPDWQAKHWLGWVLWSLAAALSLTTILKKFAILQRPVALGLVTATTLSLLMGGLMLNTATRTPWGDELREFAASINERTGPSEPILLYKVGERMWPFYLGLRCYESATQEVIPEGIDFHWLIVGKKSWDKDTERKALSKRFGTIKGETPLSEPHGKVDYVLVQMAK